LGSNPTPRSLQWPAISSRGCGTSVLRSAWWSTTPDTATEQADAAIRCQRRIERTYRAAMSALVEAEDVRAVIAWREMYRRGARLGDLLERVAERVWYAVVKRG
jgi:hypothetical protein